MFEHRVFIVLFLRQLHLAKLEFSLEGKSFVIQSVVCLLFVSKRVLSARNLLLLVLNLFFVVPESSAKLVIRMFHISQHLRHLGKGTVRMGEEVSSLLVVAIQVFNVEANTFNFSVYRVSILSQMRRLISQVAFFLRQAFMGDFCLSNFILAIPKLLLNSLQIMFVRSQVSLQLLVVSKLPGRLPTQVGQPCVKFSFMFMQVNVVVLHSFVVALQSFSFLPHAGQFRLQLKLENLDITIYVVLVVLRGVRSLVFPALPVFNASNLVFERQVVFFHLALMHHLLH